MVEKVLLRFETRLPSTDIGSFTVTERTVLDPAGELKSMLVDTSLQSFSANFSRDYGIHLSFSGQAVETVKGMARAQGRLPGEVCEEILSDYGHGLKLLELEHFEVTPEVLSGPQEVLNQLIKDLYSPGATGITESPGRVPGYRRFRVSSLTDFRQAGRSLHLRPWGVTSACL